MQVRKGFFFYSGLLGAEWCFRGTTWQFTCAHHCESQFKVTIQTLEWWSRYDAVVLVAHIVFNYGHNQGLLLASKPFNFTATVVYGTVKCEKPLFNSMHGSN